MYPKILFQLALLLCFIVNSSKAQRLVWAFPFQEKQVPYICDIKFTNGAEFITKWITDSVYTSVRHMDGFEFWRRTKTKTNIQYCAQICYDANQDYFETDVNGLRKYEGPTGYKIWEKPLPFGSGIVVQKNNLLFVDGTKSNITLVTLSGKDGARLKEISFGESQTYYRASLFTDKKGNAFLNSNYNKQTQIGPYTIHTLDASYNNFFLKLDSTLSPRWIMLYSGDYYGVSETAFDIAGNMYLKMAVNKSSKIKTPGGLVELSAKYSDETFIIKLDVESGRMIWVKRSPFSPEVKTQKLFTDRIGNVMLYDPNSMNIALMDAFDCGRDTVVALQGLSNSKIVKLESDSLGFLYAIATYSGEIVIGGKSFNTIDYVDHVLAKFTPLSELNLKDCDTDHLKLFPNPASRELFIQTEKELGRTCHLQIVDAFGKVCYESTQNETLRAVNLENFEAGLYIVYLRNENGAFLRKKFLRAKS